MSGLSAPTNPPNRRRTLMSDEPQSGDEAATRIADLKPGTWATVEVHTAGATPRVAHLADESGLIRVIGTAPSDFWNLKPRASYRITNLLVREGIKGLTGLLNRQSSVREIDDVKTPEGL
jgi:hypothetical protein